MSKFIGQMLQCAFSICTSFLGIHAPRNKLFFKSVYGINLTRRSCRSEKPYPAGWRFQWSARSVWITAAVLVTEDGFVAEDMRRVLGVMQLHNLTALNTWKGTQIDFIITTSEAADGRAKSCVPLSDFPAWKLDGLRRPLTASIPSGHPPWRHRPAQRRSRTN